MDNKYVSDTPGLTPFQLGVEAWESKFCPTGNPYVEGSAEHQEFRDGWESMVKWFCDALKKSRHTAAGENSGGPDRSSPTGRKMDVDDGSSVRGAKDVRSWWQRIIGVRAKVVCAPLSELYSTDETASMLANSKILLAPGRPK